MHLYVCCGGSDVSEGGLLPVVHSTTLASMRMLGVVMVQMLCEHL